MRVESSYGVGARRGGSGRTRRAGPTRRAGRRGVKRSRLGRGASHRGSWWCRGASHGAVGVGGRMGPGSGALTSLGRTYVRRTLRSPFSEALGGRRRFILLRRWCVSRPGGGARGCSSVISSSSRSATCGLSVCGLIDAAACCTASIIFSARGASPGGPLALRTARRALAPPAAAISRRRSPPSGPTATTWSATSSALSRASLSRRACRRGATARGGLCGKTTPFRRGAQAIKAGARPEAGGVRPPCA